MQIRTRSFLIWMRDKFAAWLANTTAFTFMWLSVGLAIGVLFVWDGVWSRHQAPDGMELSFQAAGWALRLWVVFGLVGVVALFRRRAKWTAGTLLATWLLASVMSYGHALGFMATGQMQRYAKAQVVTDVEQDVVSSATDQVAILEAQKAQIRADRDAEVAEFRAAIDNITSDGLDNDDQADAYRQSIVDAQASARARVEAIDAQILARFDTKQEARVTASAQAEERIAFDPLYMWIAGAIHGDNPTDAELRTIAARVGGFWALLVELLAGCGPAILYAAHAHFADRRDMPEADEDYQASDEPPPATKPNSEQPDPRANWTDDQWRGKHGGDANGFYKETADTKKLRIPPVLKVDQNNERRAAE
ncbi:MAG: hypothetical protein AAF709_14025 [Pseudomonadota bacterium]